MPAGRKREGSGVCVCVCVGGGVQVCVCVGGVECVCVLTLRVLAHLRPHTVAKEN